ncbi:MAG: ATP-dependent zinc metalloprotease FtsH [Armatimonadetes bacterium]|nr:ATP-dependent zinc metalloprotease FtsH [Armatimonadota bacterium]
MVMLVMVNMIGSPGFLGSGGPKKLSISEFQKFVDEGRIKTARWSESTISGELKGDNKVEKYEAAVVPVETQAGANLLASIKDSGASVEVPPAPIGKAIIGLIATIGMPILLAILLYVFFVRASQAGGNQAMSFGRSRAKRVGETGQRITFEDVAGIDEAKQELSEIVDFLKNTKKYVALGAKIPKGILLTGPPGVGKTHLARAIAGEAGVPFFHISGSDFVEMFVGVGAARVRDLFETAKAHRPCLIFIDEIDAVGRQRGAGLGGGHDEREQTLNQLLVEMDGFDPNTGVIMIAATNRPDVLDPALLRPGRFDRQIVVDAPDARGREMILNIHARGKPMDTEVQFDVIARRTPGFTGADLANSLNEAALLAARRNRSKIGITEIEEAIDRVMMGPARQSRRMNQKDRELTAYHEAGHAIVGELLEHCDPIHKVTILPRGHALGITWSLPPEDQYSVSKSELIDDITMSLGGLVAEEVVYGERWTGASSDLERVTAIARGMVCEYGMSEKLGTRAIGKRQRNPFLGRQAYEDRDYSEEVARQIDEEVHHIVDQCHARATQLLTENRQLLDNLAQALLERETLNREEFLAVVNDQPLPDLPVPPKIDVEQNSDNEEKASRPIQPPRFEPGPA